MEQEFSFPAEDFILIGKVVKAHGMRGEFKMFSYSGQPGNITAYEELVLVDRKGRLSLPLSVIKSRSQGKMAIVLLETVNDRTRAEHLEGMGVLLAKTKLPVLKEDEFYWHQLIGKNVQNLNGVFIGTVTQLFSNGSQDILVIKNEGSEILVPITGQTVVSETEDGITIDPPPGLLDLYTKSDGNGKHP
jgi:16S rRNA processing protein RimM